MMVSILIFTGLLLAGVFLVWLLRRLLGTLGEASALAVLVAPLIIYAIANGRIAEFTGFGVTTKFNKVAESKVTDLAGQLAIKSRLDEMNFARAATFQTCSNYFIIRDDFGKQADHPLFAEYAGQIARAIKAAMLCGDFYGVVVVDGNERFLGLFRTDRFLSLLAYPMDRYCIFNYKRCTDTIEVATVLGETELGPILKDPDVRVKGAEASKYVVQESQSLAEIVRSPEFGQASVFAVLDKYGKFIGLLPKQAIYDKVVTVLLEPR
jgi:hypothetical protein